MTLIPTYKYEPINNIISFEYLNTLWDKTEKVLVFGC